MTEALLTPQPFEETLTDGEIADIKDQLRHVSAIDPEYEEGEASLYYDASTMATLNAFSAVSFPLSWLCS